jgi:hypothetical protein
MFLFWQRAKAEFRIRSGRNNVLLPSTKFTMLSRHLTGTLLFYEMFSASTIVTVRVCVCVFVAPFVYPSSSSSVTAGLRAAWAVPRRSFSSHPWLQARDKLCGFDESQIEVRCHVTQ